MGWLILLLCFASFAAGHVVGYGGATEYWRKRHAFEDAKIRSIIAWRHEQQLKERELRHDL